jgi:hypothetical protein
LKCESKTTSVYEVNKLCILEMVTVIFGPKIEAKAAKVVDVKFVEMTPT